MFGRATIRLGIGPHSSCYYITLWSLSRCGVVQGNNLTVSHVSRRQPVPGVPLTVRLDLLESEFVHAGRGSAVSREQLMMVLSRVDVLHIRASYYTAVSLISYVPFSLYGQTPVCTPI